MTDEQLAAMHRLLALYHRNLAKEAVSTSCNSITAILRSGLRMRPHRYQGALRSWNAFMNANNKTWSMATSTNDVTRIGVMQGINDHVKRVFDSSREDKPWGR